PEQSVVVRSGVPLARRGTLRHPGFPRRNNLTLPRVALPARSPTGPAAPPVLSASPRETWLFQTAAKQTRQGNAKKIPAGRRTRRDFVSESDFDALCRRTFQLAEHSRRHRVQDQLLRPGHDLVE